LCSLSHSFRRAHVQFNDLADSGSALVADRGSIASQAGDELHAVKLELQLRSIVIKIRLQSQDLSTAVVLVMTSEDGCSGKTLEVLLVQRLSTLSKALEDDQS
jgi:hypothetical protein